MAMERMKEASRVMDLVIARDASPDYLYYGGVLWPRAARSADLAHAWMKFNDPAKAAMEAPAGLDPSNGDPTEKLNRLYRAAGAPVKATRALEIVYFNHRTGFYPAHLPCLRRSPDVSNFL